MLITLKYPLSKPPTILKSLVLSQLLLISLKYDNKIYTTLQ